MLMKWKDLEPGDILKVNEKFVESFAYIYPWLNNFSEKTGYEVVKIICRENTISIFFSFISVAITYDGNFYCQPDSNIPVFEIVELKED